jgi:hypothetical protein
MVKGGRLCDTSVFLPRGLLRGAGVCSPLLREGKMRERVSPAVAVALGLVALAAVWVVPLAPAGNQPKCLVVNVRANHSYATLQAGIDASTTMAGDTLTVIRHLCRNHDDQRKPDDRRS